MKTVFSSSEIAHVWATQRADWGKSPSALTFQGTILRSYATDLGRIFPAYREQCSFAVLNVTYYSNTTAKHQGQMRQAVSHFQTVFELGGLGRGEVLRPHSAAMTETEGRKALGRQIHAFQLAQAIKLHAASIRARKEWARDSYASEAAKALTQANQANAHFRLGKKMIESGELPVLAGVVAKREARATAQEKRRAAKQAKEYREATAHGVERMKEKVRAWRDGHEVDFGGVFSPSRSAYWNELRTVEGFTPNAHLRLAIGGTRVETSQGAQVLAATVRFLWAFVRKARYGQSEVSADVISRFPVLDHYTVRSIDSYGNLTVGCHSLTFAEVENVAILLNLPPFNGAPEEQPAIPAPAAV